MNDNPPSWVEATKFTIGNFWVNCGRERFTMKFFDWPSGRVTPPRRQGTRGALANGGECPAFFVYCWMLQATAVLFSGRSETTADRMFCDRPWQDELQQIIAATGFAADAGHFEAPKRLTTDERASDRAIEI